VLEFFQYSCPHCYTFTPDLERWRKQRTADVDYRRLPINWDNSTVNHTKTYYTLEQMSLLEALHEKFFATIHRERRRMLDVKEIAEFMAANGVDRAKWDSNFNSFSVNTRVSRAGQVWRAYKIEGTPAVGSTASSSPRPRWSAPARARSPRWTSWSRVPSANAARSKRKSGADSDFRRRRSEQFVARGPTDARRAADFDRAATGAARARDRAAQCKYSRPLTPPPPVR